MGREDWTAAADALEREASLELSAADRASALKLLARIQLSKLRDPASAEQAATHAAELREDDFVAWVLIASARLARGDSVRAAEALMDAAELWPNAEAQALMLLHAAQLMDSAGALEPARSAYGRVLRLQPALLTAHLGLIRAARGLDQPEAALEALAEAAERASAPVAAALRRATVGVSQESGRLEAVIALLDRAEDTASLWTLAEAAALAGDTQRAIEAFSASKSSPTPETRAVSHARRARLHAEQGESAGFTQASLGAQG